MSVALDYADELAAHLAATVVWCSAPTPAAERVPVVVDRKMELPSIIAKTMAKIKGAAIVILYRGGKNADPKSQRLNMGAEFSIYVMTTPIYRKDVTCDELTQATAEAAHGWTPAASKNPVTHRVQIREVTLQPMEGMVVYELDAAVQRLSPTAPNQN